MAKAFYVKLAAGNLARGWRMYGPYCAASALMSGIFFIILNLVFNQSISNMPSGSIAMGMFGFGTTVMLLFTVGYMLYLNSFLIRRRKKEFGLYAVLGMERRHVARVILWENFILSGGSLLLGLCGGAVFGRLVFMGLIRALHGIVGESEFVISIWATVMTCMAFAGIFVLTSLYNLLQVRLASPVDLLKGTKKGEKKVRFVAARAVLGALMLAAAYALAIGTRNEDVALAFFWPAVILVIFATQLLMTAGSVFVLGALQKNPKVYYKPRNFITISGLSFRMRQNATGLANICILCTMVIVTISCCCSLYFGQEAIIAAQYTDDISYRFSVRGEPETEQAIFERLDSYAQELAAQENVQILEQASYHSATTFVGVENGEILWTDDERTDAQAYKLSVWPLEDFNRLLGREQTLEADEVLLLTGVPLSEQTELKTEQGALRVARQENDAASVLAQLPGSTPDIVIVAPDMRTAESLQKTIASQAGLTSELSCRWVLNLDAEQAAGYRISTALRSEFYALMEDALAKNGNNGYYNTDSMYVQREANYGSWGGLLFLGVFFSLLFLINTVIILYFKQISEGYDDRERFEIMQKVGLSDEEVKRTINRQMLIVFLLPLAMALLHVLAAGNMISWMIRAFQMLDVWLTLRCILVTSAIFALVYLIVFRLTARTYYKLVKW